jgi:hypothetical protein
MQPKIIDNCNINKTCISKILSPWTSSRANELRKEEAVNRAIKILTGKHYLDQERFFTGAYSERSHCSGRAWLVNRVTSTISELGAGDEVLKIYDFSNFVIDPSI